MYFAAALEADGGVELLRGSVITAVNSSKLWSGYIFLQYSCAKVNISARRPPAILGTDIDLGYLGHIFVVAERFQLNAANQTGERPPLPSATMTISRLFVRSEARMLSSVVLPLPLNSALRRSSSPASPTDANLIILLSLPRVLCPHYSIFFLKCKCSEEVKGC